MANKVTVTATITPEAAERIRDAAFWMESETVSSLLERGALELIAKAEKKRGSPFPKREGVVKVGRPKKA